MGLLPKRVAAKQSEQGLETRTLQLNHAKRNGRQRRTCLFLRATMGSKRTRCSKSMLRGTTMIRISRAHRCILKVIFLPVCCLFGYIQDRANRICIAPAPAPVNFGPADAFQQTALRPDPAYFHLYPRPVEEQRRPSPTPEQQQQPEPPHSPLRETNNFVPVDIAFRPYVHPSAVKPDSPTHVPYVERTMLQRE